MKRLPRDKRGEFVRLPTYWCDEFDYLSDKELGALLKSVLDYAFTGKEPNPDRISSRIAKPWLICKRDIDYQIAHHHAYRYREPNGAVETRNSREYGIWRNAVFQRDDYTCRICGQHGGKLNAHHIKPFAHYPELRMDINNGITLCYDCHRAVHRHEITCPTNE